MTQFKVGDRVKLKSHTAGWWGGNLGKIGTVIAVGRWNSFNVKFDNSEGCIWEVDRGDGSDLELVPSTPPITIQHEGYNYTRGEPVVPEWVKDGAWVVEKETGGVMRLAVSNYTVKATNMNGQFKWYGSDLKTVPVRFRPFTNSDWKWGMWAEYRGEKVFVCSGELPFDLIRIDAKPDGKIYPTLGSNGYVNISTLTPTTAP